MACGSIQSNGHDARSMASAPRFFSTKRCWTLNLSQAGYCVSDCLHCSGPCRSFV